MERLNHGFFTRDAIKISKELLGKKLVHKTKEGQTSGMIVETEAYKGPEDKASHAYGNLKTERTKAQFLDGGHAYIYLIYGMYYCFNIVVSEKDKPEAVLVRALEPLERIDIMKKRRRIENLEKNETNLTNGPSKLCEAMKLTKKENEIDLCSSNTLYLTKYKEIPENRIIQTKRINVDYAEEAKNYPWRFYIKDNKFISTS